jgi:protein TonB
METKALVLQNWDDLVFENRNKEYGAYALRRFYYRRMLMGVGISLLIVAFLINLPTLFKEGERPNVVCAFPIFPVIELTHPPVFEKQMAEQAQTIKQEKIVNKSTIPVVTTQKVDDTLIPGEAVTTSTGNYETGVAAEIPISGLGTAITEVPVTKPAPDFILVAEVMPEYAGGYAELMKFIKKKINYSSAPKRMNIDGTVYVSFIVNGDGSLRDVAIVRGVHKDLDREAMRVISMLPGWIGGKQGGFPVAVKMVLPIKFSLDN